MLTPMSKYRPTQTADSGGGFEDTHGAAVTVFGIIEVHENETMATFRAGTDIAINDVLEEDTGVFYRVVQLIAQNRAPMRSVKVERIERPITP